MQLGIGGMSQPPGHAPLLWPLPGGSEARAPGPLVLVLSRSDPLMLWLDSACCKASCVAPAHLVVFRNF